MFPSAALLTILVAGLRVSDAFTTAGQPVPVDAFFGADLSSRRATPESSAGTERPAGSEARTAGPDLHDPVPSNTAADARAANGFCSVGSPIGADSHGNTVTVGCLDNGSALQWSSRAVNPGAATTIDATVQFTGFVGPSPTRPARRPSCRRCPPQ